MECWIEINEMKSQPEDHNKKNGVLANKARNARRKRLDIRRIKTAGMKQPLHFWQMLPGEEKKDACSCSSRKRNCDYKEVTSEGSSAGDVSGKDKKLKGVVGNRSIDLCFSSSDPTGSSKGPGGDRDTVAEESEFAGKEEADKMEESGCMTRLKCGSVSVIGRRRVMEDALTVAPGMVAGEYEFFAAYDGHGGARVANACRDWLHHLLEIELLQGNSRNVSSSLKNENEATTMSSGSGDDQNGVDWNKVMKACFSKMDEQVAVDNHRAVTAVEGLVGEAEKAVGSTAVVVMVGPEELVVANCGDSRAVLCRGGVAEPLSNDHKPDRPDEKERVEAAGGRIINWEGCRVQGVLATSRSIGDHYLKPYVISEPEVTVNKRTDSDDFLVIATDGLWDVVSNDVACEVVRRCLNGRINKRFSEEPGAAEAAAILVEFAIAKGSRDNISVIVVDLKKAAGSKASKS